MESNDSPSPYEPSYTNKDPGMNIPVHSQRNLAQISPYLNFDPAYLPQSQPEFIFPEGAARQRGRFELAFSQIGVSCMTGAAVGGVGGLYNGLRSTTLAGHTGKLRRTHGFGVLLSWSRGSDDEFNTLAAATATGLLYKSTAGLKKCGIGGGIGLALASAYCLWTSRDRLQGFQQEYNPARWKR
ncbi:Mitochondrial import inner membrane translocase subunit Tim23 [Blattella germanica]|nr:Mitochondrial import inner membrane translocase subunit Tim23 [Blattella germanica]